MIYFFLFFSVETVLETKAINSYNMFAKFIFPKNQTKKKHIEFFKKNSTLPFPQTKTQKPFTTWDCLLFFWGSFLAPDPPRSRLLHHRPSRRPCIFINQYMSGWWLNRWTNPSEKYASNWLHLPNKGWKFQKSLSCHHLDVYIRYQLIQDCIFACHFPHFLRIFFKEAQVV